MNILPIYKKSRDMRLIKEVIIVSHMYRYSLIAWQGTISGSSISCLLLQLIVTTSPADFPVVQLRRFLLFCRRSQHLLHHYKVIKAEWSTLPLPL